MMDSMMEVCGIIALVLYFDLYTKLKRIKKQLYSNDKNVKIRRTLKELKNKECILELDDKVVDNELPYNKSCTIIDSDDEWIKLTFENKKGKVSTKLLRIDLIEAIKIINEDD
jgi:uncharacterized protein YgiM (DUF1202 family)